MEKILSCSLLVAFCVNSFGGMSITIENDFFDNSDDNYTHGTELGWSTDSTGKLYRVEYGFNQLIYSPQLISIPENQPEDRPWCGIATLYRETWSKVGLETVRSRWSVGVLGPSAGSDHSQRIVHKWTGNQYPAGWPNQLPDEPVVNYFHERSHPIWLLGKPDQISFRGSAIYGGELGTAFINVRGGCEARLGWNTPCDQMIGGIQPKLDFNPLYFYGFSRLSGLYVFHDATIDKSFFHDRPADHSQSIENVVAEESLGFCLGYGKLSIKYALWFRSAEFKKQVDTTDWGVVSVGWSQQF